ncbi:hypothetical protein M514_07423 [Trichuris suis]|uniref:Uncharacterized protein n=1 Tax=Trichuris suis TaxID=68888 RepID=A0A085NCB1_9BILA|nr:hypothetical protein M514_07423 [Trichuris suis]
MRKKNYESNSDDELAALNDGLNYESVRNSPPQFAISPILNALRRSISTACDASIIDCNSEVPSIGTPTDNKFVEHTSKELDELKCDSVSQFAISSILNSLQLSKSGKTDASTIDHNDEVPSIGTEIDNTSNDLDESECDSIGSVVPQFAISSILNSLRLSKSGGRDASIIEHNDEVPSIGTESDNKFDEHTSEQPDELKHESVPQFAVSSILNSLRLSKSDKSGASVIDHNDELPSIGTATDNKFAEHTCNEPDESECESIGSVVPQFAVSSILNSLRLSKSGGRDASIIDHNDEVPSTGTATGNKFVEYTSNDPDESECESIGTVVPQFAISLILNSLRLSQSDKSDASITNHSDVLSIGTTDDSFIEHTSNDLYESECDATGNVLPQFAVSSILNSLRLSQSGKSDASIIDHIDEVPSIGTATDNRFAAHTCNEPDESECESTGSVLPQFAVSSILNSLRLSKSDKSDASIIDHNDEVPSIGTPTDNKFDEHTSKEPDELKHESVPQFAVSSSLNSLQPSKSNKSGASVIDHNDELLSIGTATENKFVEHTCNEPDESECESIGSVVPQFAVSSILNSLRLSKSDKNDASIIEHSDEVPSIMTLTDNNFTSSIVISESCKSATTCQSVPSSNRSTPSGSSPLNGGTSLDLYAGERRVLSEVEKLKMENLNLEVENDALRDRVASLTESQCFLQLKVDRLLKENEELRKTYPRCKHCGKVEEDSVDQWEGQVYSQLNMAVQAQVDEAYVQLSESQVEISKANANKESSLLPGANQTAVAVLKTFLAAILHTLFDALLM